MSAERLEALQLVERALEELTTLRAIESGRIAFKDGDLYARGRSYGYSVGVRLLEELRDWWQRSEPTP